MAEGSEVADLEMLTVACAAARFAAVAADAAEPGTSGPLPL
jgi:hypothetical protein